MPFDNRPERLVVLAYMEVHRKATLGVPIQPVAQRVTGADDRRIWRLTGILLVRGHIEETSTRS